MNHPRVIAATLSGRSAAVARMVWDHEVVSSNLTAPTTTEYIPASNLTRGYRHGIRKTQLVLRPSSCLHLRPVQLPTHQPKEHGPEDQGLVSWPMALRQAEAGKVEVTPGHEPAAPPCPVQPHYRPPVNQVAGRRKGRPLGIPQYRALRVSTRLRRQSGPVAPHALPRRSRVFLLRLRQSGGILANAQGPGQIQRPLHRVPQPGRAGALPGGEGGYGGA